MSNTKRLHKLFPPNISPLYIRTHKRTHRKLGCSLYSWEAATGVHLHDTVVMLYTKQEPAYK